MRLNNATLLRIADLAKTTCGEQPPKIIIKKSQQQNDPLLSLLLLVFTILLVLLLVLGALVGVMRALPHKQPVLPLTDLPLADDLGKPIPIDQETHNKETPIAIPPAQLATKTTKTKRSLNHHDSTHFNREKTLTLSTAVQTDAHSDKISTLTRTTMAKKEHEWLHSSGKRRLASKLQLAISQPSLQLYSALEY